MHKIIGSSIIRFDSCDKVTGKAQFPGDINFPDQVFMHTIFSPVPHAIIDKVETTDALNLPGVIAILTAEHVPYNGYGLIIDDQPVLCGSNTSKPFTDRVRFVGDQVAVVIAESEHVARQAEKYIKIGYSSLAPISNPMDSLADGAELFHPGRGNNILFEQAVNRGAFQKAYGASAVRVEAVYHTPAQEHAYLQPEAGIAYFDEQGRIMVVTSGQWVHGDRAQIARALQVPEDKIRVKYAAIGGAFGGKEDISVQITLALAVQHLDQMGIRRPVKTVWTRRESMRGHSKRHPFTIQAKWGVGMDGKIIAASMEILADAGAYASSTQAVMGCAVNTAIGPYYIPNVHIHARAVYTNNIPNGSFRAFGSPQVTFAAEMQVNKLAQALGMDPVELRMRNLIKEGEITPHGTPLPKGISIQKVLRACAERSGWKRSLASWELENNALRTASKNTKKVTGIGIAAGYKSFGIPPDVCWAGVEIHGKEHIERVIVRNAAADLGQGAHSIFKQVASSILNVSMEMVELIASDTSGAENSGSSSASRVTFMAGNAIIGAAQEALKNWNKGQKPAVGEYTYTSPKILSSLNGKLQEHPNFGYGYVAQSVEVEIDRETGVVRVVKVISANDVGKALNPLQVKGQTEGAIIQALGYAKMENFRQSRGEPLTDSLATYLIPTIMDIPSTLEPIILEEPDSNGPLGARGMGEMPLVPFAPAYAAAVHNALGKWFDDLPITPENIVFSQK